MFNSWQKDTTVYQRCWRDQIPASHLHPTDCLILWIFISSGILFRAYLSLSSSEMALKVTEVVAPSVAFFGFLSSCYSHNKLVITPCAYARDKAIGFVCHHLQHKKTLQISISWHLSSLYAQPNHRKWRKI